MVNESGNDGEEGQCLYDGDFEPPRPLAAILRDAKRANSPQRELCCKFTSEHGSQFANSPTLPLSLTTV